MHTLSEKQPDSGISYGVFEIKKSAKKRYKYQVRQLRRQREHFQRERMGTALPQSRHRDFWKEVRKLTKASKGQQTNVPVIDGVANDEEISKLFSFKLKDLLNSAIDPHTRSDLFSDVNSSLTHSDLASSVFLSQ